jgi:hypothetical protein
MALVRSAAAAAFLLAAAASGAYAAEVPKLNVERMCRDSAKADAGANFDANRCIDSEHRTRDELASKWTSFPAPDRQQCTQLATLGGSASYVALITCLEMNRDARESRAGNTTPPPNRRKK